MQTNAVELSNETLNFIIWYSGMKKEQIEKAFERWKTESKEIQVNISSKTYRVIDNTTVKDKPYGTAKIEISEEGAKIIWSAYEKLFGKYCQPMDTRESRGGICYTSEIENWKKQKALPSDFDFMKYTV